MNKQNLIEMGRIDYIKGVYNKPPDIQMWRPYDQGWNYERYLLPNLHPNIESIYLLANYNFLYHKEFNIGYRAFHEGFDSNENPFIIGKDSDEWLVGWSEAKYIADKAK